jgi:1-deoxy-D-xylulose-5-phosphate synthase
VETGQPRSVPGVPAKPPAYTEYFANALIRRMETDEKVVAITAAMPGGTGLDKIMEKFPDRVFDVGIAEQFAVTFSGGLAAEGYKPVAAIYSTFLMRAYDQVFHDVCLQDLPVVFAMDRGGLVGADGPTHHGLYDISYLRCLPNIIIMAPKDEAELRKMLKTALRTQHPTAIRFPRDNAIGVPINGKIGTVKIGKGEVLREGRDASVFAYGSMVHPAINLAEELAEKGYDIAVINSRFAKPIDKDLILEQAGVTGRIITMEEGVLPGGFGSAVQEVIEEAGLSDVSLLRIGVPDAIIPHGSRSQLLKYCGLDAESLRKKTLGFLKRKRN